MTAARAAVLGVLVIAVALVATTLLGSGDQVTYKLRFQNAGQLVKDNDVQVGGRRVGAIRSIELTSDNQAEIEIGLDEDFAPLHEGTTATIRATSLSGVANRYIALAPGPNSAPELDEGATLRADATTAPVDLDQLFATLGPEARKDLQRVITGSARQLEGRGAEAAEGARYLAPALGSTARLAAELTRDQRVLTDFVVNGAKVVQTLAARRDDLSGIVGDAERTASAVASENTALAGTLDLLPSTLRQATTTFGDLDEALDDLDTLVDVSKPATKDLAPLLRRLRPLVAAARPTIGDLRTLVRRPGAGNDLVELVQRTPRLAKVARPALRSSRAALRDSVEVLEFARPYTPDLVGWIRDFGQAAASYDANGHYARIQPIFNAFQLTDNPLGGTVLEPRSPAGRLAGLDFGNFRRCPGAATQANPDKGTPYRPDGLDCDPSQTPPGP